MTFDRTLLDAYRTLLQTTNLQRAYQEFVRLFRYLRIELERQLPDCRSRAAFPKMPWNTPIFLSPVRWGRRRGSGQRGSGGCRKPVSSGVPRRG